MDDYSQLPIQVMRQNGREDIHAVFGFATSRYLIHLDLAFEFAEQSFPSTKLMVEPRDLACRQRLVADHGLIVMTGIRPLEQIELNWPAAALNRPASDKDDAVPIV